MEVSDYFKKKLEQYPALELAESLGGRPCLRGTQVSVSSILDFFRSEKRVLEIAAQLNQDPVKIHDALNYAIDILQMQIKEPDFTGQDLDDIVEAQTGGIYLNPFRDEQTQEEMKKYMELRKSRREGNRGS